jgi:hypothetical protein
VIWKNIGKFKNQIEIYIDWIICFMPV